MTVLQPEMVTRLSILSIAAEMAARTSNGDVGGRALLDALPGSLGVTAGALDDHVKLMEQQDLVKGIFTMGGLAAVFVRPRGKDLAAQFERDRRDPVDRLLALEDDYLRWLYTRVEIEGVVPVARDFLDAKFGYLGIAYTEGEVEKATSRLHAKDLLEPGSLDMTETGRKTVEHKRSVRDLDRVATVSHVTTHITDSTNVSVGSSNVTQTATIQASWADEVTRLLEIVGQSMAALPDKVGDAIAPLVEDAREGVAAEEKSRVKRALSSIAGFLNDTAAGALGGHLATQIPQVMALL
ncbi:MULTISPECIES: hypothetical protein [unclassified Microbacterium]|uniref:hypothetical protein n=1 Tax=unclassified Microbacterium TaxID=2609290 RepID=UPI0016050420|nr:MULTISPECIES: hypothetical protein [unclassified Microbacterium]QNA93166.1 hypothetical protein G4G29_14075 [Microbacterium sp. Se63.02b]QYM63366.1 hypothetical protein K1X59_14130 [Microbacterium sp. Se5.02b]